MAFCVHKYNTPWVVIPFIKSSFVNSIINLLKSIFYVPGSQVDRYINNYSLDLQFGKCAIKIMADGIMKACTMRIGWSIQPILRANRKYCWINNDRKPKLPQQTSYKLQNISMHFNVVLFFKNNAKLTLATLHITQL
jgi:hypothetical protein